MRIAARTLVVGVACLVASADAGAAPQGFSVRAETSLVMRAGQLAPVSVEIRHSGSDPWAGRGLTLEYRWIGPDSRVLGQGAELLPRSLAPGESIVVCRLVRAPDRPGRATLEWSLEQRGNVGVLPVATPDRGSQSITITSADRPVWSSLKLVLLFGATIGHVVLVVFWIRRLRGPLANIEELAFHSAVIGLGSLQLVLHTLAFTVGLSFWRGVVSIAAVHAGAAWWILRRNGHSRSRLVGDASTQPIVVDSTRRPLTLTLAAGVIVLAAIVLQWVVASAGSLDVPGTDAAHYHIPNAVNISLGANPFGLPATGHFYPMGTSVLIAWFILPLRDPLLADLAAVFPFLLTWFSLLRLFRITTGESGFAWGVPLALVIGAMPMVRLSLFIGSDLAYTAAFLAVTVILLDASTRGRVAWLDLVSLALACGMLVGTKTAGTFAAVTLVGVYGAVALVQRMVTRRPFGWPERLGRHAWMLATLMMLSGGIWLVRNWLSFGSPLAPSGLTVFGVQIFAGGGYADGMYLNSVAGDLRSIAGYDVAGRFLYWLGVWCGPWFPAVGLLVAGLAADLIRARRQPPSAWGDPLRAKLAFAAATVIITVTHLLVMAGAPWTSLENYLGFSLRYVLPCLVLYVVLGYVCAFAEAFAWWRRRPLIVSCALLCAAAAWYVGHQGVDTVAAAFTPGRITWLSAGGALLMAVAVAFVWARRPGLRRHAVAATVVLLALAAGIGAGVSDTALVQKPEGAFAQQAVCAIEAKPGIFKAVYFDILAHERATAAPCSARRIFATMRLDAPLDMQPPTYENQVLWAREPALSSPASRAIRPGTRPCDYVIADRGELATSRGVPLVNHLAAQSALREIGQRGHLVLYAPR